MGGIAAHPHAGQLAAGTGAAGEGMGARLEEEEPTPLPHHEAVAVAVERARCPCRIVAAPREGAEVVEGGKSRRAEDVAAAGDTGIDKA